MWPQLVLSLALMVVSYAIQPRPRGPAPPSMESIKVPTAEYGRPIPVVFGTVEVKDINITWYGDLGWTPIRKKSK